MKQQSKLYNEHDKLNKNVFNALKQLYHSFEHNENSIGNKAKTDVIKYNDDIREALNNARATIDDYLKVNKQSVKVIIHDTEAEMKKNVYCEQDLSDEIELEAYRMCLKIDQVVTLGKTIAEPVR